MALLKVHELNYPYSLDTVQALKPGMRVRLNGRMVTGRDRFHRYLYEGGKCPTELKDSAVFHCGPIVLQQGGQWVMQAAGPTTSMREEPYMAALISKYQIRVIVGKGGMGEATRQACKKNGCVYLQAVGGAGALLAHSIRKVSNVYFIKEFGLAEAVWEIDVAGFEAVVTMDARGHSLYRHVEKASRTRLRQLAP